MKASQDPEVAANLARLATDTGVPVAVLIAAINDPPPEGIDPARWRSACQTVGRNARPFPRHVVEEIRRMAAPQTSSPAA